MKTFLILCSLSVLSFNVFAADSNVSVNKADSLKSLLKMVKEDALTENKLNKQRERTFAAQKSEQQRLLNEAKRELAALEARGKALQQEMLDNEKKLQVAYTELDIKQGNLKELFGVVRQNSAEAASRIRNSIVSAQYPGRDEFLTSLAERKELPTIKELRQLWVALQTEMTESGAVVKFNTDVVEVDGKTVSREVTRIGTFNLISDGEYLTFFVDKDKSSVQELVRQPSGGELALLSDYESASDISPLYVDPTSGPLLERLVLGKTIMERYHEGGTVGYIITGVLILGLIIVLERLLTLTVLGGKVRRQIKVSTPGKNPLGRIMAVYLANKDSDVENLELKLDEAVLKEMPAFERGVTFIKVLAAVSPLLGLFGTVTGMIQTFQSITLFGATDPKLMAGGISTALMTTVLGLVSAIPLIVLHSIISSKSKRLVHVLEEQSVGLIAQHSNKG